MKIGLFAVNMSPCTSPEAMAQVARAAEAAGFESLWTGEHVVLPDPQAAPSPLPPEHEIHDPAVALTWIAAHTTTIRLGTGIIILPQRNPLVLAKELASVDVLSGGRLIFGIGVGYLQPEFEALGIPFEHKGARTMDYLEAMLRVWSEERPAYDGRFVRFSGIQQRPRPVQQPSPPIVFGGMSPQAFRRAVGHGHGWYGFALDLDSTAACLRGLREAAEKSERPKALGRLEITVTPRIEVTRETVAAFRELGVDRLVVYDHGLDLDGLLDSVGRIADEVIRSS